MADITLAESLTEIPAATWDAIAAPEQADGRPIDPFTTHRFLMALEASGSTGGKTGWLPKPLILSDAGRPAALLPLWLKTHSQGEYIFDHGWAEAYERAGGRYYPKLQAAVPFTPVSGRRFLGPDQHREALAEAAISITAGNQISSLHVTFCTPEEAQALSGFQGLIPRKSQQFHWFNRGYATFDDFLADLSSRKRKMIRKEREAARAHGLTIHALSGDQILPEHWSAFWAFYQDTGARKWGRPYLTRAAFTALHETMRDDMLLVLAFDGATPVAGALNFIGRDALFGRYWGALAEYPALHFELCYYQAIDFAIAQGLQRVEAGAQGEHKLARGYLPQETWSLHWITDPGFRRAVADFVSRESLALDEEIGILTEYGPFRRSTGDE
ncbi:GNAT family N-acetyltransferase [Pseudomonas sp. GX19020]|uniref:GNAT family N-acetyltransferase n=1 Tax=Pseudomonas sp. GX19020 TaxID=2942277 RepID=UPI002019FAF7|nr:GNAT family N-acetyltransferase [Pseudomonas sp. GX19020]MCL4066303.1 GNAT family N-acetyltransferase [Pseudomonas sp. GX19020]